MIYTGIIQNWIRPPRWRYMYFNQDNNLGKIEKVLNNEFGSLCELLIDNKVSSHLWDYKKKQLFSLE